jgi:hypothetical protein
MLVYLLTFVLGLYGHLFSAHPLTAHRYREMLSITRDVLTTDATPDEALTLENIVAWESGWERSGVGPAGEVGAFQLMSFPWTTDAQRAEWKAHGAKEALRRLREQGIFGYMGCTRRTARCEAMADRRTWPAELYRMAFDPPGSTPTLGQERFALRE